MSVTIRNLRTGFLAFAAATLAGGGAALAVQPAVGYYTVFSQITGVAISGGATCIQVAGDQYQQTLYYPGPAKKGAVQRQAYLGSVLLYKLPATPAAGATAWSGAYTFMNGPYSFKEAIDYTISFVDAVSFTASGTIGVPGGTGTGTCTLTQTNQYIYSGK